MFLFFWCRRWTTVARVLRRKDNKFTEILLLIWIIINTRNSWDVFVFYNQVSEPLVCVFSVYKLTQNVLGRICHRLRIKAVLSMIAVSDQFQRIQISAEIKRWLLTTIRDCSPLFETIRIIRAIRLSSTTDWLIDVRYFPVFACALPLVYCYLCVGEQSIVVKIITWNQSILQLSKLVTNFMMQWIKMGSPLCIATLEA